MKKFGLIGYPLGHSFSKKYFSAKFEKLQLTDHSYDLFEMQDVSGFKKLWDDPDLIGVNVTVPHKENVMPFLDNLDISAKKVGAVNVIKRQDDKLIGYNSDYYGFGESLKAMVGVKKIDSALILGTGGASKAVKAFLTDFEVAYAVVSRSKEKADHTYDDLMENPEFISKTDLIINSTPLGTYPKEDTFPMLPYEVLHSGQFLYDLVYNPAETQFMKFGLEKGATVKNGLEMLELQAERSWEIWNK